MPWFYAASDCLLMTSDLEGSPNCVMEALACGVPVVGVLVGNVSEMIDTPERGRIVPRDPHLLANAVEDVLRSRAPVRGCLLPERLRASNVAKRLVEIYRSISLAQPAVVMSGSN